MMVYQGTSVGLNGFTLCQMRDPLARFVSRYNFNRELVVRARSPRILLQAANRCQSRVQINMIFFLLISL